MAGLLQYPVIWFSEKFESVPGIRGFVPFRSNNPRHADQALLRAHEADVYRRVLRKGDAARAQEGAAADVLGYGLNREWVSGFVGS